MRFEGKHKGVLTKFSTEATKGDGINMTKAVVEIRMNKSELAASASEELANSVFSFLVEDPQQGLLWTCEPLTPKGTYESHTVKLFGGKSQEMTPKILKVKPVNGEAKVDVDLLLPFPCTDEAYAGKLHVRGGSQVTVDLVIRKPELPLGTKVVDGKFGNPKHVPA